MIPILGRMVSPRDRRAPCERVVLALRQFGDVGGSVVQGMQLAAAGQGNGIIEGPVLRRSRSRAGKQAVGWADSVFLRNS